jgi:DNA repair exonuclease SbcCD ATPase subunit
MRKTEIKYWLMGKCGDKNNVILLKELKLNNFLSHEKTEIAFGETEKFLIDGRSGSGKSSISEAIIWTLYGRGRSESRNLVRRGAKTAGCSLRINVGTHDYVITRTTTLAGKNTLVVTHNKGVLGAPFIAIERTGIKDTQDWIEKELLRASYPLFCNSVAYTQEKEASFVEATASKRKDLLLEIVGAGNFEGLYEKAKLALTATEMNTEVGLSNIKQLEEFQENAKHYASKYDQYKEEQERATKGLDVNQARQKSIELDLSGMASVFKQVEDKKTLRNSIKVSIERTSSEALRYRRLWEEHKAVLIVDLRKRMAAGKSDELELSTVEVALKEHFLSQQRINAHLSNKPQQSDFTKDIELINARLIPLIKDTNSCPSGDACPFTIPIKGQIDFLSEQIAEKTQKMADARRAMELWEKEYTLLVKTEDPTTLYAKQDVLKASLKDLSKTEAEIEKWTKFEESMGDFTNDQMMVDAELKTLYSSLTKVEMEIAEAEKKSFNDTELAILREKLKETEMLTRGLQNQRDAATRDLALATKAQEDIKNASQAILEARATIKQALSDKDALIALKEALSPRGVKAVVVDYLVPNLEEKINGVLCQMSDFRIRLDTQKATADDEGVKEGLFITVINDIGEELPFSSYSGGEKVKITVAIAEALASLMPQVGFRLMDENIVSLDSESTEGFIDVLTKLQQKFPQLIVISHLQEVKDMFEKQLKIIKVNGISKII